MRKIQIPRAQVSSNEAIWNELSNVAIQQYFPTNNDLLDELSIFVLYFNEMESGGHEAVLNWTKERIEAFGFHNYVHVLSSTLEKIGAPALAEVEKRLAPLYWPLYHQLEAGEIDEEPFYEVIEQADQAYFEINEHFRNMAMNYFLSIYEQVFDIV